MRNFAFLVAAVLVLAVQGQTIVEVEKAGTLAQVLTQEQKDTCTVLTVKGKLNSADVRLLRQMAGYKEEGRPVGCLQVLNLEEAEFVNDKTPYMVLDAAETQLAATAVPTGSSSYSYMIGKDLADNHKINKDKYRHIYWEDHRNDRWNGNFYVERNELMPVSSKSVRYRPQYYLGRDSEKRINIKSRYSTSSYSDSQGRVTAQDVDMNKGQFFFASDTLGIKDWKQMRKYGITRFCGHRLVRNEGGYSLEAFCRKGHFPHDMFYGCSSLQTVTLAQGQKVDKTVYDQTSKVKFNFRPASHSM